MWNTAVQHLAKHTLPMTGGLSTDEFGKRERHICIRSVQNASHLVISLAPYFVDWEL